MSDSKLDYKIAIIGGGPAGSFSALFLNKFAKNKKKHISIDVYDYKHFINRGKQSCNMCAGIISYSLIKKLENENIFLPTNVIKNVISGYQLHSKHNTVYFEKDKDKRIYSVFRGQGPVKFNKKSCSFDQYLLNKVSKKNVSIINQKVTSIDFSKPSSIQISTDTNIIKNYDFVIGAFGVNTKIKDIINFGYRAPKTIKFLQFEINLPLDFLNQTYKNRVQMFPVYKKNIWFLTLAPKQYFVTVTVFGGDTKLEDTKNIITNDRNISHYLPKKYLKIRCYCTPQLPITFAKKPYHNRFLVVGDACVSRYLKNGIESAYQTAYLAADTIINHGTTKEILKKYYYKRCKRLYKFDNICGKILYSMKRLFYSNIFYTEAHMITLKKEQIVKKRHELSDVFWDIFTGDRKYRNILRNSIHPALIITVLREFFAIILKYLFQGKAALRLPLKKLYKLLNNCTVAIIGGGPGGSACAIKLAKLAKEINLKLNIILFERKDFKRHHNQCVGILSPPLTKILKNELDIILPKIMIKSEIPGYELNTEKEKIFLKNYREVESKTFSVRRSEFDNFLLEKAKENNVKIINSRVTDLEFYHDIYYNEVRIFSESNYTIADVVVCAFGLDEELLERLHIATKKRFKKPKRIMKTFVTRFDHPAKFLKNRYDKRIYAFLLSSIKNAEFGAITIKDNHIVVNVAGEKITSVILQDFISLEKVINLLPENIYNRINCFSGKYPTSPSKKPYGDRYVTVGDATGWLRPLKGKGINLAVITGINAAKVMINKGISKKDFDKYSKLCKSFKQDYKYGKIVRIFLKIFVKSGIINTIIKMARTNKKLYNLLYDSVSAESSYKNIFINFFKGYPKK